MARIIETEPPKGRNVFVDEQDYRFYAGQYRCQGCGALVEMEAGDILGLVDVGEYYVDRDDKRRLWIQQNWNGKLGEDAGYCGGTPCCGGDAFFIEEKAQRLTPQVASVT